MDSVNEEIIERKESAEVSQNNSTDQARQDVQQQKETAELMRKGAMERLSKTQAREGKRREEIWKQATSCNISKKKQVVETKMKES